MTELPLMPPPSENMMSPGVVVLGRFQPLHLGHISLIKAAEEWRIEKSPNSPLILCIGSSNRPESMDNPWSYKEREAMIDVWLKSQEGYNNVEIVSIPDIQNPPKWVSHAENYHSKSGFFFTSDISSADLYDDAGWNTILHPLEQRNKFEGWRVRATALMLSTINDDIAVRAVLSVSIPESVINYLIEIDGLRRLAFLVEGGEPVG